MADSLKWKRLCALATPLVRREAWRMAARLGLRFHDRQDVEQELWLELLVRHAGRDRDDSVPGFLSQHDWPQRRAAVRVQLQREVESISAALARSWPFWRRVRPAPERFWPSFLSAELSAADPQAESRRLDLFLDIAELLHELPPADRRLCESLMTVEADLPHASASTGSDLERRFAALRNDLAALGLHEYL